MKLRMKLVVIVIFLIISGISCTSERRTKSSSAATNQHAQDDKTGYLGIIFTEHPRGVRVSNVLPDSPASKSGIRGGDVIIAIDGDLIVGKYGLQNKIHTLKPGMVTRIRVIRHSDTIKEFDVHVEELPSDFEYELNQ